jgi:hypothetical protein
MEIDMWHVTRLRGAKTATRSQAHRACETVVVTCDGILVERVTPERRTSADRLKAALLEHPADARFADDLAVVHADLRFAFSDEVSRWPGE